MTAGATPAPGRDPALIERARKAALRSVQIGRRALAIEEEDWRAMLERVAGARSSRALSVTQLAEVRKELERLGWTPEPHGGGGPWRPKAKHPHQRKVYALWGELKRRGLWRVSSVHSLRQFVIRITAGRASGVEWLTPEQATQVIEALKAIAERAGERLE